MMGKALTTGEGRISETQAIALEWRQVARYVICAVLGLVGGAAGVALAIGLAIAVQLRLPPSAAFSAGVPLLMVMAAGFGLAVAWLLTRAARGVVSILSPDVRERGLQVALVFSVFSSVLQTLLFFAQR
jgi:hypothetical protein